jgi:hypothetical protein
MASTPSPTVLLTCANLQLAAEAFHDRFPNLVDALTNGNGRSSNFPETLATQFAQEWEVVAHQPDTPTGFSGTLFKNKTTGELVMSLRSTEFADDAARDGMATGQLEIRDFGWAFGQIADMKTWFDGLNADPGKLQGKPFSVTGYSLGGHLATAFNLLMNDIGQAGRITATYTFNGAGVGELNTAVSPTLAAVIQQFNTERDQDHTGDFLTTLGWQMYAYARNRVHSGATSAGLAEVLYQLTVTVGNPQETEELATC